MIIVIFPLLFVFVGWLIFGKKTTNPYIKTHKRKWKNTEHYHEYLKWLDSKGGDLPIPEVKFKEDMEVEREIKKAMEK